MNLRRWFFPLYGLLFAVFLTVAWVGHTAAKSSRQRTAVQELGLIERTVLPNGDIYQAGQKQAGAEITLLLICERNDIYSALGKEAPMAVCAGHQPTSQPTTSTSTTTVPSRGAP